VVRVTSTGAVHPVAVRVRQRLAWLCGLLGAAVVVAFTALPLLYLLLMSLTRDPVGGVWPLHLTLGNYRALSSPAFGFYPALRHSLLVSGGATAASLVVAVPAAYALGRLPIPGRAQIMAALLAMAFFPGILLLIPLRTVLSSLGLYDRLAGIGIAQLSFTVPLAVWFLSYAFRQVPDEVEEAAKIDGAGTLRRVVRIVLPMARPGLAATTAVVFLASWSDFLFSSGLNASPGSETLPVMMSKLPTIGFLGGQMAGAVMMSLPVALVIGAALVWLSRRTDEYRPATGRRRWLRRAVGR
jgi:ABC-type glycerol-3-phosphate transport system permease component